MWKEIQEKLAEILHLKENLIFNKYSLVNFVNDHRLRRTIKYIN